MGILTTTKKKFKKTEKTKKKRTKTKLDFFHHFGQENHLQKLKKTMSRKDLNMKPKQKRKKMMRIEEKCLCVDHLYVPDGPSVCFFTIIIGCPLPVIRPNPCWAASYQTSILLGRCRNRDMEKRIFSF